MVVQAWQAGMSAHVADAMPKMATRHVWKHSPRWDGLAGERRTPSPARSSMKA